MAEQELAVALNRILLKSKSACSRVPGEFKHHATAGVWYSPRQWRCQV